MEIRVVGRGEGERTYNARGSVMFFKALAERRRRRFLADGANASSGRPSAPGAPAHQLLGGLLRARRTGVRRRGR